MDTVLKKSKGVILWDIDGTLISTQRHSKFNLHQKVLKDLGFGLIEPEFETQGVTDWEILNRLLLSIKYRANHNEMNQILHGFIGLVRPVVLLHSILRQSIQMMTLILFYILLPVTTHVLVEHLFAVVHRLV